MGGGNPVVFQSFQHPDLRVIAITGFSDNSSRIVARKDRGIYKPTDLKGKNIAAQKGTVFHFFLHMFLARQNLSTNDVKLTFAKVEEFPSEEVWEMFDGIVTKEPHVTKAMEYLGENGIVFEAPGIFYNPMNIVAQKKFVESGPESVKKILRALIKAEDFMNKDPEAVWRIVSKTHGHDSNKWKIALADLNMGITMTQPMIQSLEDIARWAINEDLSSGVTDIPVYLDYVYIDGLESVRPESVTIIR